MGKNPFKISDSVQLSFIIFLLADQALFRSDDDGQKKFPILLCFSNKGVMLEISHFFLSALLNNNCILSFRVNRHLIVPLVNKKKNSQRVDMLPSFYRYWYLDKYFWFIWKTAHSKIMRKGRIIKTFKSTVTHSRYWNQVLVCCSVDMMTKNPYVDFPGHLVLKAFRNCLTKSP